MIRAMERAISRLAAPQVKQSGSDADFLWDAQVGWRIVSGEAQKAPASYESLVLEGFRKNPVVSACVRQIVTSLSEAPVGAFRPNAEGGLEELLGNAAAEKLQNPNPRDSYVEYIERLGQHFLIGGNAYIRFRRLGSGRIDRLTTIRPDHVQSVITDRDNIPEAWRVLRTDEKGNTLGQTEVVDANDIIHIPDLDPLNEVFGAPRLWAAALEMRTDNEATDYVSEVLGNHGVPALAIGVDANTREDQITRAEERFREKFGPNRGRGKVVFVPGGLNFKEIAFNLQHLEFPDLRRIARESICAVYGVDPRLVAITSASKDAGLSGQQYKTALEILWKQTLIPLIRRFESALRFLGAEFGDVQLKFKLDEIEALGPDRTADAERAGTMAKTGVYTDREIRAETGHDPEPEEGNIVRPLGVSLTPVGEEPPPPSRNGASSEEGESGGEAAGGGPKGAKDDDSGRPRTFYFASAALGAEERHEHWKAFDAFARHQEPLFQAAASRRFAVERDQVVRLVRETLRDTGKDLGPVVATEYKGITDASLRAFRERLGDLFDDYHAAWAEEFRRITTETVELVGIDLAAELGIGFNVTDPFVQEFIRTLTNNLAGQVPDATFAAIVEAVDAGILAGDGTAGIASRVQAVFDQGLHRGGVQVLSAEQRAILIARTMSTQAANGGAMAHVRARDLNVEKSWLTQGDDRVRDTHLQNEAEGRIGRDDVFPATGEDFPGEPNCRCSVLFHPVSIESRSLGLREYLKLLDTMARRFDGSKLAA